MSFLNLSGPNHILGLVGSFASALMQLLINIGKAYAGVVYELYKGAKADSWRGFGKGLGKGVGNLLFRRRGLAVGGRLYNLRALYDTIRRHINGDTLSFILASHFAQGFQGAKMANEEECLDVLRRWQQLAPDLKLKRTGASSSSSPTLMSLTSSTSATSASTTISKTSSTSVGE